MLDTHQCWQAICNRDRSHDGQFVFAVISTGIYCRPSCPARRPLRNRVQFYSAAAQAENAGFRPCKRCVPQGNNPRELLDQLISESCRLLDNAEQPLTLTQLAARIGLSPSHLARAFKARTGLTPKAWSDTRRRARLENQLGHASSVLSAALMAGYSGTRALYEKPDGLSPAQRRQRGAGTHLRYTLSPCKQGFVLLAASPNGLCALLFGDNPQALQNELYQRFAGAELSCDDQALGAGLKQLLSQLPEPPHASHLPDALQRLAFQQRAQRLLQHIRPA